MATASGLTKQGPVETESFAGHFEAVGHAVHESAAAGLPIWPVIIQLLTANVPWVKIIVILEPVFVALITHQPVDWQKVIADLLALLPIIPVPAPAPPVP